MVAALIFGPQLTLALTSFCPAPGLRFTASIGKTSILVGRTGGS
jgi:hypothetical protein